MKENYLAKRKNKRATNKERQFDENFLSWRKLLIINKLISPKLGLFEGLHHSE